MQGLEAEKAAAAAAEMSEKENAKKIANEKKVLGAVIKTVQRIGR